MQSRWFVYFVRCSDHTLFAGFTDDLDREVAAHNAGTASKFTRLRRPVRLVYWERLLTKRAALRREAEIKKLPKQKKERLVLGERGARLSRWE